MSVKSFSRMSKAGKRVALAKDVLAQLASGKLEANTGNYVGIEPRITEDGGMLNVDNHTQLQSIYNEARTCRVCALGSMFVCAEKIANNITVDEAGASETGVPDPQKLFDYLGKFFSREQLELIESVFETHNELYLKYIDDGIREFARGVYKDRTPEGRLVAVMKNIIRNNGTFVIPRDAVRDWKRKDGELPEGLDKFTNYTYL